MQPTPLRGPQIVAFLKAGIGPMVFLIYTVARLMGKPLGCNLSAFLAVAEPLPHHTCGPLPLIASPVPIDYNTSTEHLSVCVL